MWGVVLPWVLALQAGAGVALPSVAVLALDARGETTEVQRLVVDAVTQTLRDSGAFSRVSSVRELEEAVGFEKQRQLLDCDAASCMAEIAGAMGVDFILSGTLGKVGALSVLSLRLTHMKTARAVSVTREDPSEERLYRGIRAAVMELVSRAGLARAPAGGSAQAQPGEPSRHAAVPSDAAAPHGSRIPGMALMGVGAAGLALAPLVLLAGVAAGWVGGVVAYFTVLSRQRYSADAVGIAVTVGAVVVSAVGVAASLALVAGGAVWAL